MFQIIFFLLFVSLFFSTGVPNDSTPIPAHRSQIDQWFSNNVLPLSMRTNSVDPILVTAEAKYKVIHVQKDGRGDYKTINEALRSIPDNNKNRVLILIGSGTYEEKIHISRSKPFITFYGDSKNLPILVFNDTGPKVGTFNSASLIVDSDYFVAVNIHIANSAPRGTATGQAVAMTIQGEKAAFYNCRFSGFQDTLADTGRNHFYKDCYVEGTIDFIFGDGKSIFLNTIINVFSGDNEAYITAHGREKPDGDTGYSFVHSTLTGRGGIAYLGRPWRTYARVVFVYSELTSVVNLAGWSINHDWEARTVYFGEYQNWGPASRWSRRVNYAKNLSDKNAENFIKLEFINGSTWLLPPPNILD